jgi:hypothetical protein
MFESFLLKTGMTSTAIVDTILRYKDEKKNFILVGGRKWRT